MESPVERNDENSSDLTEIVLQPHDLVQALKFEIEWNNTVDLHIGPENEVFLILLHNEVKCISRLEKQHDTKKFIAGLANQVIFKDDVHGHIEGQHHANLECVVRSYLIIPAIHQLVI